MSWYYWLVFNFDDDAANLKSPWREGGKSVGKKDLEQTKMCHVVAYHAGLGYNRELYWSS